MFLSDRVFKNLELDYIFSRITVYTPYGEVCKKKMEPYLEKDQERLSEEFDRIEKIVHLIEKQRYIFVEMRNLFKTVKDLRGTFQRIEENEILSTVELFEIKTFVALVEKLYYVVEKLNWNIPQDLSVIPLTEVSALLDPQNSGVNTFYIYDEYSEKLADIRKQIQNIEKQIAFIKSQIKDKIQQELDIKLRPNGEITINKSHKELLDKVQSYPDLVYGSETYMNITYRIRLDQSVDALAEEIQALKALEEEEEYKVREALTAQLKHYRMELKNNAEAIGAMDLLVAKGYMAIGMEGTKPIISPDGLVHMVEGRHIKVEDALRKQGKKFTPITVELKQGVTCITGANMGGKTISLKLLGLLSAMAQFGLFVPAEKFIFSLKSYIFFSLGDLQSTDMGLSTFGAEILEMKKIIERAHEHGLILVDELARGTNPAEGYAISKAIIQYLKHKNSLTVLTTHFDGLAEDPDIHHLQVRGLVAVDYQQLKQEIEQGQEAGIEKVHQYMDYRLMKVENRNKVPRDAINIARLMGLQEEILQNAERVIGDGSF